MKRKYIIFLMYVLTSVCLFSIGFSSWTIVQNASVSTTGNIEASDMFNYDDFIYFDGDIQGFKYCSTCFLNEDLSKSTYYDSDLDKEFNRGTCTINLQLRTENCSIQFNDKDSIRVEVELKLKDSYEYNIFDSTIDISNTVLLNGAIAPSSIEEIQEGSYKLIFVYSNYLKDYKDQSSIIDKEPLQIKVHFNLTDEQFVSAYDSFANMNFECIVRIEGC